MADKIKDVSKETLLETGAIPLLLDELAKKVLEKIKGGELDDYLLTLIATASRADEELKNPVFISVADVQKIFSDELGRTTVHNYTVRGTFKSYKLGRSIFYKRAEIIAAVESGEVKRYKRHY